MQERAGVRSRAEAAGRKMIRAFMPDQHRGFFEAQSFVIVGSLDDDDRPWASILTGRPGFMTSPDPRTLVIDARPVSGDPLARALHPGSPLGLLGIEPQTRRRNRMNGQVTRVADGRATVRVDQSFGNCPQYIQARAPSFVTVSTGPEPLRHLGPSLEEPDRALIAEADTFFIATAASGARDGDPLRGVDVSHRGGRPGFVRVAEDDGAVELTVPDFRGNSFFNTLGNIAINPSAGLLFIDFSRGDVLMLTGSAEVVWEGPELAAFTGAQRLLKVRPHRGIRIGSAIPLRWTDAIPAPQLAATATWAEAGLIGGPADGG